jgi:glycosyltransferase involved in cell wall biosynthesis
MTKILFISEYLKMAGTETFMMNVIRESMGNEYHYDFLIFRPEENSYVTEARLLGCNIFSIPSRKSSVTKYLRGLDHFFKTHGQEYNAVHWCGGAISSIAPLAYAAKYQIPVRIVHAHSSSCDGVHTKVLHFIFKHLLPIFCTHYFACSTLAARFFFGNKTAKIISNGIPIAKYQYNKEVRVLYRTKLNINPTDIVIGHIGRFETVKNHDFLIDVFFEIHKCEPNSKLILIGTGSLFDKTKEKARCLGLEGNVLFLGERNDINKCLQVMDCFVMPSIFEGLPFVLIEAQAASIPCVISDTINEDAAISPLVSFMGLDKSAKEWANTVINNAKQERDLSSIQYLCNSGYSIRDTVRYLENVYSSNN